jgi:Protein of unknown function (DUF2808)
MSDSTFRGKLKVNKLFLATFLLVIGAFGTPAQASYEAKVPHLMSSRVEAAGRFGMARYTMTFHITGRELSELFITQPQSVRFSNSVHIFDESGNALANQVDRTEKGLRLIPKTPIAIGTKLTIELDHVKSIDNSRIYELETSAKMGSISDLIPLDTVRMMPRINL